jgi:hypothetical protein
MPNAMDIGFSFPTYMNIFAGRRAAEWNRRNCHQHSELGSRALLIEPTVTRMARFSGPAAPPRHPTAMHKAFIAALKQVKTGKFDADGDEL